MGAVEGALAKLIKERMRDNVWLQAGLFVVFTLALLAASWFAGLFP